MSIDVEKKNNTRISAKVFFNKFLLKTTIRCLVWYVATYFIVQEWPGLKWLWYVVTAFIFIGIIVSGFAFLASQIEK
jgi:hypothetical protein